MNLMWNPGFLRTRPGMNMALEVVVALVGGIVGIVFANGLESFLYWTIVIISGILFFTHMTNLTQSLESKIPYFAKLHLLYLAVWTLLLLVVVIWRFVAWSLMSIVDWLLLILMAVDLFFKYRSSRSAAAGPAPDGGESGPPANTEPTEAKY